MRHLKYEWEKFFSFRYFWFLCAVFLLFNLWNLSEQIRMEFPASSVRQLYIDFQEQPEESKGQWLEEQKAKKNAHYTGNQYMEEELFKKLSREWIQTEKYDEYLEEIKERSAKMSGSIFSDEGTFAWRNAKVTPAAYEKLKGTKLSFDLSDGVVKATKADFTDLCMTILLMAAVYFLILDEKKNKLYPLLRSASRGRAEVIGAKLGVMAGITGFLVLLLYGSNYLFIFYQYGFGNLTRPLQSVTAFYESPFRLTAGQYLWMYLLLKLVVCYAAALLMIWIAQKAGTPAGAILAISTGAVAEYLLTVLLPSVSYADGLKYINLVEYIKIYPLFTKYHNLDFFEYPVNAMRIFPIVLPCLLLLFIVLNLTTFCSHRYGTKSGRQGGTEKLWRKLRKTARGKKRRKRKKKSFISDSLVWHESFKSFLTNRTVWVCVAVLYGAILLGRGLMIWNSVEEEYYKYYMTKGQGELTQEKLETFENEKKRYDDIYSMTPEQCGLSSEEISSRQEEIQYQYSGFMRAYEQVQYVVENNRAAGTDEQQLIYEGGYEQLFGEISMKGRLIGELLCVLVAVYSAAGLLGMEYDLKVMNLLQSTKKGRGTLLRVKLGVAAGVTTVMFILVKIPVVMRIVQNYPLTGWTAKVRSMRFAGTSVFNCPVWAYVLLLLLLQLGILYVVILCVTALSAVLKDTMLTLILSVLLFGGTLVMEWGGLGMIHSWSINTLLDGHRLLQSGGMQFALTVLVFWGVLPLAAGTVLHRVYKKRGQAIWN